MMFKYLQAASRGVYSRVTQHSTSNSTSQVTSKNTSYVTSYNTDVNTSKTTDRSTLYAGVSFSHVTGYYTYWNTYTSTSLSTYSSATTTWSTSGAVYNSLGTILVTTNTTGAAVNDEFYMGSTGVCGSAVPGFRVTAVDGSGVITIITGAMESLNGCLSPSSWPVGQYSGIVFTCYAKRKTVICTIDVYNPAGTHNTSKNTDVWYTTSWSTYLAQANRYISYTTSYTGDEYRSTSYATNYYSQYNTSHSTTIPTNYSTAWSTSYNTDYLTEL